MNNNQAHDDRLARTRRLARAIRWLSIAFLAGLVGLYLWSWFWPTGISHAHGLHFVPRLAGLPLDFVAKLDFGQRVVLASVSLPYLVAMVWAFYRLGKLLSNFERGEFFARDSVSHLRAFAGLLFAAKLLALAALHLRVGIAAHLFEHRHGLVAAINLSNEDAAVLLMCALFFLIAHMMEEGRRLVEENKEFV